MLKSPIKKKISAISDKVIFLVNLMLIPNTEL